MRLPSSPLISFTSGASPQLPSPRVPYWMKGRVRLPSPVLELKPKEQLRASCVAFVEKVTGMLYMVYPFPLRREGVTHVVSPVSLRVQAS